MVYADVPEHEGFNDGEAPVKAPRPISTDGWLERISDQLQVFVDAINDAREGDGADDETDTDGSDQGDKSGDTPPADEKSADAGQADAAKKTTQAKKTAEVKGD